MSGHDIPTGLSLREARALWKCFRGSVEDVRRTGEERYSHPSIEGSITVNKRRKDAPRKLVVALRHLAAEHAQSIDDHGRLPA